MATPKYKSKAVYIIATAIILVANVGANCYFYLSENYIAVFYVDLAMLMVIGIALKPLFTDKIMDYYSVNVTNNGGSNLTVTGGGVYLKGSTVTVTATPVQYYRVKWDDSTTEFSKTLSNLSARTDLTVTAEVDVYTGVVTVKKDADT